MVATVATCGLTRMPALPRAARASDWCGSRACRRSGSEEEVGVEVEASLGDDVGLERADGAGGGVAGVGGGGLAGGFALLVELAEGGLGHDALAADFEGWRQVRGGEAWRRRCGGGWSGWCGRLR